MDQPQRILLAFLLSIGVVVLYHELVVVPRRQASTSESPASTPPAVEATATTQPATAETPAAVAAEHPESYLSSDIDDARPIVVETDLWTATLTRRGGRLTSVALKKFRQSVKPESPPLELVEHETLLPLTVAFGPAQSDAAIAYTTETEALHLTGDQSGDVIFSGKTSTGDVLQKRVRFLGNSYVVDVEFRVTGNDAPRTVGLVVPELEREGLRAGNAATTSTSVILSQGKLQEIPVDATKLADLKPHQLPDAQWVGWSVPYFAGVIVDPQAPGGIANVERVGSRPAIRLDRPLIDGVATFKLFFGPRSKEVLAEAGYELSRLLDFGWFWFIAIPMLYALRMLHRLTGNYGLDIILLTGLVRGATIPLTTKSFRSMKEMQKIQPQLKRLQEQYKDDQAKLQKEMMDLYKRHGVNPFGGCAPMLLQIPIFVGLYNALLRAIELRHAPFALWIADLSAPERLMIGGIGVPVMTLVMGATMLVQQWLSPQQGDPTQRQMMMIMPLVFTFMFFNFPSGLVLYWLVSNLLGIAQQYYMLRTPK